jgi:hypothetical protein
VCSAKGRIFNNALFVRNIFDERPSIFLRDKPLFSSQRTLHKDYYGKDSAEKEISGRESQGA